MTDRLSSYKNRGKVADYKQRLKNCAVELRKTKKDEQLTKRRNLVEIPSDDADDFQAKTHHGPPVVKEPLPDIKQIVQGLGSSDPAVVLQATRASRKMLSKEVNPPIDVFIEMNLVPRMVDLLRVENPEIQFEAAWALTNIVSGNETQTRYAINAGVCEEFIKLLRNGTPNIVEQVLWGLSNIAGTGAGHRDHLLSMGILNTLVSIVPNTGSRSLLATAAWCLSNLCRKMGSPPDLEPLLPSIPVLTSLLRNESTAVVSDACWALSYFTDGPNERIEVVSQAGVIPNLVNLLRTSSEKLVLIPALRVLGNIVTGTDAQTQRVLDNGALAAFKPLLQNATFGTRKEVVWTLSNILAGNVKQIEAVFREGLLEPLVDLLHSGDYKCKIEATWAISNLTCGGNGEHIQQLIRAGALGPLSVMTDYSDPRLIKAILDAFANILRAANEGGFLEEVQTTLEENGFIDRLEYLQMNENEVVYKRAASLISTYWSAEEEMMGSDESRTSEVQFLLK